jgi:hypothetical protein
MRGCACSCPAWGRAGGRRGWARCCGGCWSLAPTPSWRSASAAGPAGARGRRVSRGARSAGARGRAAGLLPASRGRQLRQRARPGGPCSPVGCRGSRTCCSCSPRSCSCAHGAPHAARTRRGRPPPAGRRSPLLPHLRDTLRPLSRALASAQARPQRVMAACAPDACSSGRSRALDLLIVDYVARAARREPATATAGRCRCRELLLVERGWWRGAAGAQLLVWR